VKGVLQDKLVAQCVCVCACETERDYITRTCVWVDIVRGNAYLLAKTVKKCGFRGCFKQSLKYFYPRTNKISAINVRSNVVLGKM